jgi:hypothetical protein
MGDDDRGGILLERFVEDFVDVHDRGCGCAFMSSTIPAVGWSGSAWRARAGKGVTRMATIPIEAQVSTEQLIRAVERLPAEELAAFVAQVLALQAQREAPHLSQSETALLLRIKASVMNLPLAVLDLEEATALGAAILGGIGAGVYRDVGDALGQIRAQPTVVEPEPAWAAVYDRYFREVYLHIYDALQPLNHRIHAAFATDGSAG